MPPIHPDLTAYRAVDACGCVYTAEMVKSGWAAGHKAALDAAAQAVAKPDALMAEMLEALESIARKAEELAADSMTSQRGLWKACAEEARAVIAKATAPSTVGGR